jgi:hypothetical protein
VLAINGTEMLITVCISILSILLSIFLIRMVANLLILVAFAIAIVAPIVWYMNEVGNGLQMPIFGLYVGSIISAFLMTLLTVPLWPVSSLMQWTGKKNASVCQK